MLKSIILLPLLSSIACGFFGRLLGYSGSKVLSTSIIGFTFLLSIFSFYSVGLKQDPTYITICSWIKSDLLQVNWSFLFDSLSVTMLLVVSFISFLVHLYSCDYMSEDPHLTRFMSYLSLFTFFMVILVTADNFLQLFMGWEGVGLCSYLLINFWFTRVQANKAAIKALIMNKFGDYALFIAIVLIQITFKTIDYSTVFYLIPFFLQKKTFLFFYFFNTINLICLLLFIGAVGKSAQIGLHTWLPDAMEGPTPVSALIHAATMVTAGIFLIIRCSPIFEYAPDVLKLITIIGALTAFFAATIGLVQNDIKKIIAYSTCSQLGYMTFICGLSNYSVSLFHLSNHAFFKALLFLSAGSIIHSLSNEQDIRKMGGLLQLMPFTYSMFLIGSISLAGFPFLSGFYSKDVILEIAYTNYTVESIFAYWLGSITAFFTALYSFRLLYYVFYTSTNSYKVVIKKVHELPLPMGIPLGLLSVCSIFTGYLSKDLFIGLGSDFYVDSIYTKAENITIIDSEFIPFYIKIIPTGLSLLGSVFGVLGIKYFEVILIEYRFIPVFNKLYNFLINKWYFDFLYNVFIAKFFLRLAYNYAFKLLDKGFIELLGPMGITYTLHRASIFIKKQQTGFVYNYICIILLFFVNWHFCRAVGPLFF